MELVYVFGRASTNQYPSPRRKPFPLADTYQLATATTHSTYEIADDTAIEARNKDTEVRARDEEERVEEEQECFFAVFSARQLTQSASELTQGWQWSESHEASARSAC